MSRWKSNTPFFRELDRRCSISYRVGGGSDTESVHDGRQVAVAEVGQIVRDSEAAIVAALREMLDRFAPSDDGLSEAEIACAERARLAIREAGQ